LGEHEVARARACTPTTQTRDNVAPEALRLMSQNQQQVAEAWIYVDESQGPSGTEAGRPFWLAALILERPITQDLIDAALQRLRNDPEAKGKRYDDATLARGFFHASEDSKNTHSALCKEIVERDLAAAFDSSQWFFSRDEEGIDGARLHRLSVALSAMSAFQSDYDRLHLVVARREGSFEERDVPKLLQFVRDAGFHNVAQMPHLGTRFTEIDFELVDGKHPGVQVCDFVLWAVQRAKPERTKHTGDTRWLERLRIFVWAQGGAEGGPHRKVAATLGRGFKPTLLLLPGAISPRPVADLTGPEQWELVCKMAADVHRVAASASTSPRIKHWASDVAQAAALCERAHTLSHRDLSDALRVILTTFVLICDTLPVFHRSSVEACTRAAEKRDVAAEYLSRTGRLWVPTPFSLEASIVLHG
jgi:hypothetical protein